MNKRWNPSAWPTEAIGQSPDSDRVRSQCAMWRDATSGIVYSEAALLNVHINIKDYGATGLGVASDAAYINTAIAALGTSGGIIYFPPGTYLVDAAITASSQDNLTIRGAGDTTVIKIADGANIAPLAFDSCDNLTIQNLRIDGNMANQTGLIDAGSGINATDCTNVRIMNCTILDTYTHQITFRGVTDGIISGCYAKNTGLGGEGGIGSHGFDIDESVANQCSGIIVVNNTCANSSLGSIKLEHCIGGLIANNYIYQDDAAYHASGIGIASDLGEAAYLQNIVIANNVQDNVRLSASRVSEGLVIANNTIRNAGLDEGIWVYECVGALISGNVVESPDGSGITLEDSGYCLIEGNVVRNCGQGSGAHGKRAIYLRYTASSTEKNTIQNNLCVDDQVVATQTHGIYEGGASASDNQYYNNTLIGNSSAAEFYQGNGKFWEMTLDHFQDLLALSNTYVHAAITGTGAENIVSTAITNPDVPRNAMITTSNNAAPTGDVLITGVNSIGIVQTDTITISAGATAQGQVPFMSVTSITIPAGVTAADTVSIGIGVRLGLSNPISADADIIKAKQNQAEVTPGNISFAYNWVSFTITVNDDVTIWYRKRMNKINNY